MRGDFVKLVEQTLTEKSEYELYHNDYSSAVQEALRLAQSKGYTVDEDDYFNKVASGPRKPDKGNTNSFSVILTKDGKEVREQLHMQIYNMGNKYELNVYIS
jgi:hypothetical protein